VFHSPEDAVDGVHQRVRINLHPGTVLRDAAAQVKTKKLAAVASGTIITSVTDVKSGSVNGTLTPGRNIKITGTKLKIDGTDPSLGLFFVPDAGGNPIQVDPSDMVVNHPSELIAVIPALAGGVYRVRIITQYSGSNLLKKPHVATFDAPLTVV
jgi:hypothetical protein